MLVDETFSLLSVHPCERQDNGGCQQKCTKIGSLGVCACNEGYKINEDKKTCDKIHPCDKETKGGCDQTCNKGEGEEFTCSCQAPDFKLNEDDGKTCDKGKTTW